MSDEKNRSYIIQAVQEQQQYASLLLRENEKLRATVAALESDVRRANEQQRASAEELDRLRANFESVAEENQRYAEQYQQIETQSSNLANLYVASYQLHSSVDRQTVLNTIQEIVINLIGSEQVAIYERNGGAEFHLASSFGVDAARLGTFVAGQGKFGQSLLDGQIYTNGEAHGGEQTLTACVPLKVDDRVIGAILVFSLLEHKQALEQVDHELFELLAVHASTALYCSSLHAAKVTEQVAV